MKASTSLNPFLKFMRWFGITVLSSLFMLVLSLSVVLSALAIPLTDEDTVQSWLANSSVYTAIKDNLPSLISEPGQKKSEDVAQLVELGEQVFTEEAYFVAVDDVLSGLYAWLRGEADTINFEVRLAKDRATMIAFLEEAFTERLRNIPRCSSGESISDITELLGAECLPDGYESADAVKALRAAEKDPQFDDFLASTTIRSSEIFRDEYGNSTISSEETQRAQDIYGWATRIVWLSLVIMLVLGLGLWFLFGTPERASRRLGVMLISGSILTFIVSFYAPSIVEQIRNVIAHETQAVSDVALANIVIEVIDRPVRDIANAARNMSGLYLATGAGLISLSLFLSRNKTAPKTELSAQNTL